MELGEKPQMNFGKLQSLVAQLLDNSCYQLFKSISLIH